MTCSTRAPIAALLALSLFVAACGADDRAASAPAADSPAARPTVVVTTNILGNVVESLVGEAVDVVTVMPVGTDPHDFQASAQQVQQIGNADVLIVNGADFEEGLLDVIDAAETDGGVVFEAISAIEALEFGADDEHDDEGGGHDDEGGDERDDDEEEHHHDGDDPHFFTDPARMALVVVAIADFLVAKIDDVDADVLRSNAETYSDDLEALDVEVVEILSEIPDDGRVLVTNHDVFAYFADRYDFEVAGTAIPSGSAAEGTSAQALAELAEVIEREGMRAIFADTSSSDELTQTLATEVGDIAVVELFSESLGAAGSGGETYIDMVRTNAKRIATALAG